MNVADLTVRFTGEFSPSQARLLAQTINESYQDLVKTSDFRELKEIVRNIAVIQERTEIKVEELAESQSRIQIKVEELAEAQNRTEVKVGELAEAQNRTEVKVGELAEAQNRTEVKVGELAESQARTQIKVEELAEAQTRTEVSINKLVQEQRQLQQTVGSLSETVSLSLENEAYRYLPAFLKREHKITVTKRMIRQYVEGEEIDFLAEGKRGETKVLVVGEAKTTLSAKHLTQLEKKVKAVRAHYQKLNGREIVPLMIVHRARERELKSAEDKSVIVAQSYEW